MGVEGQVLNYLLQITSFAALQRKIMFLPSNMGMGSSIKNIFFWELHEMSLSAKKNHVLILALLGGAMGEVFFLLEIL